MATAKCLFDDLTRPEEDAPRIPGPRNPMCPTSRWRVGAIEHNGSQGDGRRRHCPSLPNASCDDTRDAGPGDTESGPHGARCVELDVSTQASSPTRPERASPRHTRPTATTVHAVAKLVYATIMSLDGYTTDIKGNIEWGAPEPDVLEFINDLERSIRDLPLWTQDVRDDGLLGDLRWVGRPAITRPGFRRVVAGPSRSCTRRHWQRRPAPNTGSTDVDPEAVQRMKETTGHDISVGGPDLAGQAIGAGLVDEMHLFLTPVTLGGGTAALPDHFDSKPELVGVDRFLSGVAHLHYRVVGSRPHSDRRVRQ